MSLILDALSRAEREKREEASATSGILAQDLRSPGPVKDARVPALLVGLLLLAIVVASLVYLLLADESAPPVSARLDVSPDRQSLQPSAGVIVEDARVASGEQSMGVSVAQPRWAGLAPESEALSSQNQNQGSHAVAALYAKPLEEVVDKEPEAAQALSDNVEPEADELSSAQSKAENLIDVERVLREMRLREGQGGLEPHPVSLLEDLSNQFRDSVPTLIYSRHDFNSAGRSSVVINGETLNPSQRSRGVEVQEVLSDSVILRFEGTDFRLKALNSWVNL